METKEKAKEIQVKSTHYSDKSNVTFFITFFSTLIIKYACKYATPEESSQVKRSSYEASDAGYWF